MELENEKLQKAQAADAQAAATLAAQQKLFDSELPKWERIIASLSHNLIRTRAIDMGLFEAQDVANKLRLKIWDAIRKYDSSREAALNTWITRLLRQECVLIMQAHYNKVPRDAAGNAVTPISIDGFEDTDDEHKYEFLLPDKEAEAAFERIFAVPWFRKNTDIIFHALQNKEPGGLNEKKVFAMILSGRYGTDREIADHLDVNFAKVGEVRFKAKIVFALVEGIPISTFSKAQNALTLAKRLRTLLKPYVGELPTVVP